MSKSSETCTRGVHILVDISSTVRLAQRSQHVYVWGCIQLHDVNNTHFYIF